MERQYRYTTKMKASEEEVYVGTAAKLEEETKRTQTVFEAIYGTCVPYYDFDPKYETEAERAAAFASDLKSSLAAIKSKFPGAKIYILESSGFAKGKGKYTNSLHYIIRGTGYCSSGAAVPHVEIKGGQTFDHSIYKKAGSRQLFRAAFNCKPGEPDRPMRPLVIHRDGSYSVIELVETKVGLQHGMRKLLASGIPTRKVELLPDFDIAPYIVQNIANETLTYADKSIEKKSGFCIPRDESDGALYSKLLDLLDVFDNNKLEWQIWWEISCAIMFIASYSTFSGEKTVHYFSRKSKKYDPSEVTKAISNSHNYGVGKKRGFDIGTICKHAKEYNNPKYQAWRDRHATRRVEKKVDSVLADVIARTKPTNDFEDADVVYEDKRFRSLIIHGEEEEKTNPEFDTREVTIIPPKIKAILVRARKGSGKSIQMRQFIQRYTKKFDRIFIISSRVSLGEKFDHDLYGLNFQYYKNIDGPIGKGVRRLIIQLESLHRVNFRSSDLIILDEVESIFTQFGSDTMIRNMTSIITNFDSMLAEAGLILAMDADLSDRAIKKLTHYVPREEMLIINNTYRPNKIKQVYVDNRNTAMTMIIEMLKKGENIVVPNNCSAIWNKGFVKYITLVLPELAEPGKIIYHNRDTQEQNRSMISDVNESWKGARLLMYTATITSGISFDGYNFTSQIAIFYSFGSVKQMRQMLGRVRELLDNLMVICLLKKPMGRRIFRSEDELINYISNTVVMDTDGYNIGAEDSEIPAHVQFKKRDGQRIFRFEDDIGYKIWYDNELSAIEDYHQFFEQFVQGEVNAGVRAIKYYKRDDLPNIEEKVREIVKGLKEDRVAEITKARDLTAEEYDNISQALSSSKVIVPREDIAALQKHNMKRITGSEIPLSEELVAKFSIKKVPAKINLWKEVLLDYVGTAMTLIDERKERYATMRAKESAKYLREQNRGEKLLAVYNILGHLGFRGDGKDRLLDRSEIPDANIKARVDDIFASRQITIWASHFRLESKLAGAYTFKYKLSIINSMFGELFGFRVANVGNTKNPKYGIVHGLYGDMFTLDKNVLNDARELVRFKISEIGRVDLISKYQKIIDILKVEMPD